MLRQENINIVSTYNMKAGQLVNISDLLLFCTGNYCLCRVLFDLYRQFIIFRKTSTGKFLA